MLQLRATLLVQLLILVASTSGRADFIFTANLTNSQEPGVTIPTTSTGGPRPASFGTASFVLNDAMTTLTFTATIFNIDVTGSQTSDTFDNLMNAHIHSGPALMGSNNPVVWGFFGAPFNDVNPDDSPNPQHVIPFTTGVGGTFSGKWDSLTSGTGPEGNGGATLPAQLANIFAGHAYINFHTVQFGGGEIRGQIFFVPEPASLMMLATSLLVGLGCYGWHRKRGRKPARA